METLPETDSPFALLVEQLGLTDETPAVQMRFHLQRSRQYGTSFERAWGFALRRIRWPHDTQHRVQWKSAMYWSKETWRNAYMDRPDRAEHITSALKA